MKINNYKAKQKNNYKIMKIKYNNNYKIMKNNKKNNN